MKRILTFMFISVFAIAFSVGFTACKKKAAEETEVTEEKKADEAAPAGEEKKEEAKPAPMKK